jgi:putative ABC transport system permease protein
MESPVGSRLPGGKDILNTDSDPNIIGVVQDFHSLSLREAIEPVLFHVNPSAGGIEFILVRLNPNSVEKGLKLLREKWPTVAPGLPFEFTFLDSDVAGQYESERRWSSIVNYSTGLAMFIASLGLFGLASLAVVSRTKEIGIRKVLGAPVHRIVALFSTDVVKLVLLANAIAWPAAYFATGRWLRDFAFRTELEPWTFLFAALLASGVALATVSYHAIKAALANPVESLRYE